MYQLIIIQRTLLDLILKLLRFGSYRQVITLRCRVQVDCTMNNQYYLETLTNIDEFFRFRKFRRFYNY